MTATFEGTISRFNTVADIPEGDPMGLTPEALGGAFVVREVRRASDDLVAGKAAFEAGQITEAQFGRLQAIHGIADHALNATIGEQHNGVDGNNIVRAYN